MNDIPSSVEALRVFRVLSRGKSPTAKSLNQLIARSFERVMKCMENDKGLRTYISEFPAGEIHVVTASLRRKFHKQLLLALDGKDTAETSETEMDYGSASLKLLAGQIQDYYTQKWYDPEILPGFISKIDTYLKTFFIFYKEPEDKYKMGNSSVTTDDESSLIKTGDVVALRTILSCFNSYLGFLDNKILHASSDHKKKKILKKEKKHRWKHMQKIIPQLKQFPLQKNIFDDLDEIVNDIMEFLTNWESWVIMVDEA